MEFRDYYQTLGVARDATADDIRKAFAAAHNRFSRSCSVITALPDSCATTINFLRHYPDRQTVA